MNYLRNFLHFRLIYRSRLKSLRPSPCLHVYVATCINVYKGFVCKILPEWRGDFSAKQRPDLVKIRQNRYLRNRILTDSQKSMNEILL